MATSNQWTIVKIYVSVYWCVSISIYFNHFQFSVHPSVLFLVILSLSLSQSMYPPRFVWTFNARFHHHKQITCVIDLLSFSLVNGHSWINGWTILCIYLCSHLSVYVCPYLSQSSNLPQFFLYHFFLFLNNYVFYLHIYSSIWFHLPWFAYSSKGMSYI